MGFAKKKRAEDALFFALPILQAGLDLLVGATKVV